MCALFGELAVHGRSVVFFCIFRHGEHLHLHGALAEGDLDHVADLDVIRRLGRAAVDRDALTVAGIICYGAALDEPRNFQIFVRRIGILL